MRSTRTALLVTITLVALLLTCLGQAQEETDNGIRAQPLTKALAEFAEQTGMQLVYPSELTVGVDSNGASTEGTPDEVLDQLLASTGLEYEYVNDRTIAIAASAVIGVDDQGGASDSKNVSPAPIQTVQNQASQAQTTASSRSEDGGGRDSAEGVATAAPLEEIIVTGTNIRGIAPESSPTITFDREDIDQSGFLTTDEFIRSIPQNFGGGANNVTPFSVPAGSAGDVEANSNNVFGAGVNIRGLGAGATLALLNGRRLSPAGLHGAFVDVSSIPLSAIERIEILTDGASSIYGGDAVGGVVNFILSDDFQGAETSLSYGVTTEGGREEFRANQILGTSWGSGSGFISYEYVDQSDLFADEKDFSEAAADPLSLLPSQTRNSVIGSLSLELSPDLEFQLSGYYADRSSDSVFTNSSDNFPIQVLGGDSEQYLISPSLTYSAWGDWQFALAGDYSSTTGESFRQDQDKTTGDLDPLRVQRNDASQSSIDIVADGSLFTMLGGEVRLAVGSAYRDEDFSFVNSSGTINIEEEREVWAAFAELYVPVIGDQNAIPGIERLELNASVRHDDYSDFGAATNPKIGVLWSPFSGLSLRGSYSTSFNPPDLGVLGNPATTTALLPTLNSETGLRDIQYLLVTGTDVNNLGPEESESFTIGFDVDQETFGGTLSVSSTYYNIEFEDRIGAVPEPVGFSLFNSVAFLDQYPSETITENPSRALVDALVADGQANVGFLNFVGVFGDVESNLDEVAFVLDIRTRNLTSTKTEGVDFEVTYDRPLGTGALSVGLSGDYIIDYTNQASSASPEIEAFNRVFNPVDFRARGSIGWAAESLSANAFVNYTDGYKNDRVEPFVSVDSWITIDLSIAYDLGHKDSADVLDGTSVSLSVRNLLDEDPPFIDGDENFSVSFFDGTNATPLGRFISFNLVKKW